MKKKRSDCPVKEACPISQRITYKKEKFGGHTVLKGCTRWTEARRE